MICDGLDAHRAFVTVPCSVEVVRNLPEKGKVTATVITKIVRTIMSSTVVKPLLLNTSCNIIDGSNNRKHSSPYDDANSN